MRTWKGLFQMHRISICELGMTALLLTTLLSLCMESALALNPEGWALLHFRSGIEDDPSFALLNWSPYDENPCKWFGIQCDNEKVTSINLTGLSLRGVLKPEIGLLTNLREIRLRHNDLRGAIPFQIGELEKLEVLDLADNMLTGKLPQDLGNLSSLNSLYLDYNALEGNLPLEIGELRNLCDLGISMNKLRGTIPGGIVTASTSSIIDGRVYETGVCKMKSLHVADFSGNYFEGELPPCLHHLPRSSFNHNCLSRKDLVQRSLEDCSTMRSHFMGRRLLSEGTAGGPVSNDTHSDTFNSSSTFESSAPLSAPDASGPVVPAPSPVVPAPSPVALSSSPSILGTSISQPVPTSSSPQDAGSSSKVLLISLASASMSLVVLVGVLVLLCYSHKGAAIRPWKSSMSGELQKGFVKGVPAFSRMELEAACEDFSNIIGFSPDVVLFKGTLQNGVEIAVTSIRKSVKSWSSNSELIFWRKVESLSHTKHQNLINLLGYCAEEEPFVRMLVFEYVPNGTVSEHLHNKESEHLDWAARMRIILGVAYALEYMHFGLETPMAFTKLDTKSVYLTEEFSAKVADFGVWKASCLQKGIKSSSERSNALGHDELELSDRLAPVLDTNVHDFGILILEIVSGRFPYTPEWGSLAEWAKKHYSALEHLDSFVDPTLQYHNPEELQVVIGVALSCLHNDYSTPPSMKLITGHLSSSLSSAKEPLVPRSSPLLWAEMEILAQD